MGIALAFLAQNWMGFIMAFMMCLELYAIARVEDKELVRRYGASFAAYIGSKPIQRMTFAVEEMAGECNSK